MFDNFDIQCALQNAKDAISRFERERSDSAFHEAITKLKEIQIINRSRSHLQRCDLLFRITCDLGRLYKDRYEILGFVDDLANGISFYEQAEKMMGKLHPDRPSILSNLGNLLCERFIFEWNPQYLEMAIEHFREAEEFYRKMSAFISINDSKRYIILNDLGNGLYARYAATGDRDNLKEAIEVYRKAQMLSPESDHIHSVILNNLAIALRDRFELTKNIKDLNNAIELWEESIGLGKNKTYLSGVISNLSEGLKHRSLYYHDHFDKVSAIEDINRAISLSKKAVNSSLNKPIDKAKYLGNMANQLSELYKFLIESSKEREAIKALDKSIAAYEEIINIFPSESKERIESLNNLGQALRDKFNIFGNISFLLNSFYAYKEANELLNSASSNVSISYKIGLRKRLGDIDDMLIETILKLREISAEVPSTKMKKLHELNWGQEAMVHAEGCKSQILAELLGRSDIPASSSIPLNLRVKEERLLKLLNDIDFAELSRFQEPIASIDRTNAITSSLRRRDELSRELEDLWNRIESFGPEFMEYTAMRRGVRPSWEDLKNLIKDSSVALLSLFPLAKKTVLFILRADWDEPEIVEIPLGSEAQLNIWRRFRREIHLHDPAEPLEESWDRDLIQMLKKANVYLNGIDHIIFSPGRFGCLLPWEALLKKAELDINISTIPNLKIWSLLGVPLINSDFALVIGNPKGGDDLIYAEEEARRIAKLLGTTPLIGSQATKEMVLKFLPKASIAHFATHAYFSLKNPLDSRIILADGDLSLREIMELNIHLKLLVLSACETGMNSSLGGDEMAGFAQGFILAGTETVLVSLWSVDDSSTARLMESFFNRLINENAKSSDALSDSMEEIRNCREWNHTYYWGAFTLIGKDFRI